MKSKWLDNEAEAMIIRYSQQGIEKDIALRVYTSQLLGKDPLLVLHGGGNTSVKTTAIDLGGDAVEVLCVKGSGWDMGDIEPAGLPAVRLKPLQNLRHREVLTDEDMVRHQRVNLLDPNAPNPSVETLLHAFLPHKFVDHTHSTAVLSIANQPNAALLCKEIYGDEMGIVPYIMPGFSLAKKAAEVFEADSGVKGLVLLKHGIFTFGETALEAYGRMIEMVTRAEDRIARAGKKIFTGINLPSQISMITDFVPFLRGACSAQDVRASGTWRRFILDFRSNPEILNYVNGAEIHRYGREGVITPDHIIRTKNIPLIVPSPDAADLEGFRNQTQKIVGSFVEDYHNYFKRNTDNSKYELDPLPRVILVPGVGLFGLGRNKKDACIAADIAENTIISITNAEAIGSFEALPEKDLFDMEYWSLEQAKLSKVSDKPLAGQIVAITGGVGAIGAATAEIFKNHGAEVAVLDLDRFVVKECAKKIGASGFVCDVTNSDSVRCAFNSIVSEFGGLDILVSNAGAAWQGRIGEVDESILRKSFELNFFSHQRVAQAAVKIMLAQGTGGCLLFNASKQAVNPGADFGPYGLPKAATLFLSRQYALDYGKDGIRSNAVNADRIRSGLLDETMIALRSRARGISEKDYMAGNLLCREVTAQDVAQAFLHQALSINTTANVTTVDGGNISAALR